MSTRQALNDSGTLSDCNVRGRFRPHLMANAAASLLTLVAISQTGCLGVMSNLMHAVGADMLPAESDHLKEKKVAIVTLTDRSQYSDDVTARLLSRKVADELRESVKGIQLIREDEIQQFRDRNGYDVDDFAEIGRGVGADRVLGLEVSDMTLREGATLYRGRASVRLTVVDVPTDEILYSKEIDDYTFPKSAGQYTSETTEGRFQKLYLSILADVIARSFHPYDYSDTVALDGTIASQ